MASEPGAELVEHIAADGSVVEVVTRARMRAENLRHRSVAVVVTAGDGRLLVHRRSDDKDLLPGWWDIAAGGVVGAGEDSDAAAVRELAEELGIVASPEFVTTTSYDDDDVREVCRVYRVTHDGPFTFDDGEITEARFVTPAGLAELRASERVLPGSLAMLLPHVAGFDPAPLRLISVQRVEFTVEPFVEGSPGPHVTAPVDAVQALGLDVDFGPFGSQCVADATRTPEVVAAIVRAALDNGATHVNIDVSTVDQPESPS